MNYYEIVDPYYSLIKANDSLEATELYIKYVAGEEGEFDVLVKEMQSVPEYYASARYARTVGEDKELIDLDEILDDLASNEPQVLIIDSTLI